MIVFIWLLSCLVSTGLADGQPSKISEDQPLNYEPEPRSLGDMVRKISEGFGEGENVASIITADLFDAFKSVSIGTLGTHLRTHLKMVCLSSLSFSI